MTEYTIREENGCTFVFGSLPITALVKLTGGDAKNKVMDADLARMAGANFAWGRAEDLERAKDQYRGPAVAQIKSSPIAASLDDSAIQWLATGEQGLSSSAIFWTVNAHLKFPDGKDPKHAAYPHDPSDFGRCRKLLEQVPSVWERFAPVMGTVAGPVWTALVEHWGDLCATMDREAPDWRDGKGTATETYRLMQEIIAGAQPYAQGR